MSFSGKKVVDKAFAMLRALHCVCLGNDRRNPRTQIRVIMLCTTWCWCLGYKSGNTPFYLQFTCEPYYKGHQYPLNQLRYCNHLDILQPTDLSVICNSGLHKMDPHHNHFGIQLTDEGADIFKAKVNIEVQWASEPVIAAIERNGGVITTAYYDVHSLWAVINPKNFFNKGKLQ
ncbi:hypothetical protein B7P43_G15358 [Cryptotermes secundus]|uniref:Large ribosomal subunit protein uL15m n=1 Tax=Cryptotermes secundus TaxID=105785 RepID=A0A2J7RBA2_9NEOP|nr:hypothetical protein B7P43_G15358 [Cryptotermes secundus]